MEGLTISFKDPDNSKHSLGFLICHLPPFLIFVSVRNLRLIQTMVITLEGGGINRVMVSFSQI